MSGKVLLLFPIAIFLSGCSGPGQARHPQCQELKEDAYGDRIGAAFSGLYMDRVEANIADRQYEQCEQMFDLVQYQAQLQQEQAKTEAQVKEQERKNAIAERLKSQETQEKLRAASLGDLVNCEMAVQNSTDTHPEDVIAMVSYVCEREIDRRVDNGMVSRDKVNKMLNQTNKKGA